MPGTFKRFSRARSAPADPAYDGRDGWKIESWQGKRDPESLGEDEMHGILDDADFDGPLINYQAKGNRVEYHS